MKTINVRISYSAAEQRDLSYLEALVRPHLSGPGREVRDVRTRRFNGTSQGGITTSVAELEFTTNDPDVLNTISDMEGMLRRTFRRHDIRDGRVETLVVCGETLVPVPKSAEHDGDGGES